MRVPSPIGWERVAARPGEGGDFAEIVAGAWDFERINRRYARHLKILGERPGGALCNLKSAICSQAQRGGRRRREVLRDAGRQLRTFKRAWHRTNLCVAFAA